MTARSRPDGGFISAVRIQELKDRFLADQPYAAVLTPEKSLYDIASTVFAAQKVMLREHFRCVPAIIEYSNKHFYKEFIQPLRIPKMSRRIDPLDPQSRFLQRHYHAHT